MIPMNIEDIKPGDYIQIKSNIARNDFGLTNTMRRLFGKIVQVKKLDHDRGDKCRGVMQECVPELGAYPGTFTWDYNCIEKVFTKEEHPEYYL